MHSLNDHRKTCHSKESEDPNVVEKSLRKSLLKNAKKILLKTHKINGKPIDEAKKREAWIQRQINEQRIVGKII